MFSALCLQNCVLEDEKAELQGKLEIIEERAENYKLALDVSRTLFHRN